MNAELDLDENDGGPVIKRLLAGSGFRPGSMSLLLHTGYRDAYTSRDGIRLQAVWRQDGRSRSYDSDQPSLHFSDLVQPCTEVKAGSQLARKIKADLNARMPWRQQKR